MTEKEFRYSDLEKIKGHKNYYRNPKSGIITYKKGKLKFSTGETKIRSAQIFVELRLAEMRGDPNWAAKQRQKRIISPLIINVWDDFYEKKRPELKPNTQKNYMKNWRVAIEPFWGHRTLNQVTNNTILDYKNWYLETFPKRVFEKTYYYLRLILEHAHASGGIAQMPDLSPLQVIEAAVQGNAQREKVGRFYTDDEVNAFIKATEVIKDYKPKGTGKALELYSRARLGVMLGAKCGLRKDEALGLLWDKVNLDENFFEVWSTKNKNWRKIHIVKELAKAFRFQKKITIHSRFVFPMPTNPERHISSQIFDKVWVRVKSISKVKGRARFHDLRHTFASKTAEDNWPPIVACAVLDMSLKIYQKVYCKVNDETKINWMTKSFEGKK